MSPNQKERLIARLVSWTRIAVRSGDFVKVFAWSRCLPSSNDWSDDVFGAVRDLSATLQGGLALAGNGERWTPLANATPAQFREALQQRNRLDPSLGSGHLRSPDGKVSLVFECVDDARAPLTTLNGTIGETWLDDPKHVAELRVFAERFAMAARTEYLLVNHVSDETTKLRGNASLPDGGGRAPFPRYEARPARYLPYVPWLLVLGPKYVGFFGRDLLNEVSGHDGRWTDSYFTLVTAPTPLAYGTIASKERESQIRSVLGSASFFDPTVPERVAVGPDYPEAYKVLSNEGDGGVVWDAYPDRKGVKVVERRLHGGD